MYTLGQFAIQFIAAKHQSVAGLIGEKLIAYVGTAAEREGTGLTKTPPVLATTNAVYFQEIPGDFQNAKLYIADDTDPLKVVWRDAGTVNAPVLVPMNLLRVSLRAASGITSALFAIQRGRKQDMNPPGGGGPASNPGLLYYSTDENALYISINGRWRMIDSAPSLGGTQGTGIPIGGMIMWLDTLPDSEIPLGFVRCDGTDHPIGRWQKLADLIGSMPGNPARMVLPKRDNTIIRAE